jgi:hypothetical protein
LYIVPKILFKFSKVTENANGLPLFRKGFYELVDSPKSFSSDEI